MAVLSRNKYRTAQINIATEKKWRARHSLDVQVCSETIVFKIQQDEELSEGDKKFQNIRHLETCTEITTHA